MEGGGEFTHVEGKKIKGSFLNNYHDLEGMFINPFTSQEKMKEFAA